MDRDATRRRIGTQLRENAERTAEAWLQLLDRFLSPDVNGAKAFEELLRHGTALVRQIADDIGVANTIDAAASTQFVQAARKLGELRYGSDISVHELLSEIGSLGRTVEEFVTERLADEPQTRTALQILSRAHRCMRLIERHALETFIARYERELKSAQAELTDLNRVLGHELRNPLNNINLVAELIATAPSLDPDKRRAMGDRIRNSVDRTRRLVESVESAARSASQDLSVQVVDVAAAAREVAAMLAEVAAERRVEIRLDDSLPEIEGNPAHLQLVLSNLLSNAIKYRRLDESACFVDVRNGGEEQDRVFIEVTDNGMGIPPDKIRRIFDPSFRAHSHLDDELEVEGQGLGLALVKRIVHQIGGEIGVTSEEGGGTTFRLALPRSVRHLDA